MKVTDERRSIDCIRQKGKRFSKLLKIQKSMEMLWKEHDGVARQFLSYLQEQRLSVLSKDELLSNYSAFRAQAMPPTIACDGFSLLHALRRIQAIEFWHDQHIEWIRATAVGDALPVSKELDSKDEVMCNEIPASQERNRQYLDNMDHAIQELSPENDSINDRKLVSTDGDMQNLTEASQLDLDEKIVWIDRIKSEVGLPTSGADANKSLSPRKGRRKSFNSSLDVLNPTVTPPQYVQLQQLFMKTGVKTKRNSSEKQQRLNSKREEVFKSYTNKDCEEKKVVPTVLDYDLDRSSSLNYGGCNSRSLTPDSKLTNSDDEKSINTIDQKSVNSSHVAVANQAHTACNNTFENSSVSFNVRSESKSSFCQNEDHILHPSPPQMAQHCYDCGGLSANELKNPSQVVEAECHSAESQSIVQPLYVGDEGSPEIDSIDISKESRSCTQSSESKHLNCHREVGRKFIQEESKRTLKDSSHFSGKTHISLFAEIAGGGKIGGEGVGIGQKFKDEHREIKYGRNWVAKTQETGASYLFVSQPFPLDRDQPQTISIGGTRVAMISVVNNGKEFVTLRRVQMLYVKPMGCFSLKISSDASPVPKSSALVETLDSSKQITQLLSIPGRSMSASSWRLEPSCRLIFQLICTARYMGLHKAVILFDFGAKKIVKYVTLMAEDDIAKNLAPNRPYVRQARRGTKKALRIIHGKPPPCPAFCKPLARYPIPEYIKKAILKNDTLPVFLHGLSLETYTEYFSSLMYAEEFQMEADICTYDMQKVTMRHGGFGSIALRVPGLQEKRPSVVYRDNIYVRKYDSNGIEYQGCVYRVSADEVFVKFHKSFYRLFTPKQLYNVRFSYSRITFRRAYAALEAARLLPESFLFPSKLCSVVSEVSLDTFSLFNPVLNEEQKHAVQEILKCGGAPPYLIYGPPGTGKTVTVVEGILQVLFYFPEARVLACAPSNSASDLLLERLMGSVQQEEMLRLNAYTRPVGDVPDKSHCYCHYQGSYFCCPNQQELIKYKVVVSTFWSASMLSAQDIRPGYFSHIFLDEAGQGREPEAMIVIANLASQNTVVVLAGDHHQLGPVVHSPIAERFGLGKSFLERLSTLPLYKPSEGIGKKLPRYNTSVVTKLIRNYRSHPAILELPSRLFYDDELIACTPEESRSSLCQWEELPNKNFPVLFIGIEGRDEREGNSPSWFNPQEASKVIEIVKKLKEYRRNIVNNKDIGIISPYHQQVNKLKGALASENLKDIEVGSVENFQGQEKLVIIISTVRSSREYVEIDKHHNLGFLKNPKRFNVAITRAKSLLVIVGNPYVLSQDFCWNELLRYCILNQSYIGCPPPSEESKAEDKIFLKCLEELFPSEVIDSDSDLPLSVKAAIEEMQWPDGTL